MEIGKRILAFIKGRLPLVLLSVCILVCGVFSAVYAKYIKDIDNDVVIDIVGEGDIELAVSKNTDDDTFQIAHHTDSRIPAYIRYAVVANWKDGEGNIWYTPPTSVTVNNSHAQLLDGYYYCVYEGKAEIELGTVLSGIQVEATGSAPAGYTLHVQLLVEAIQCVPADVVEDAWGVTFQDGAWKAV